MAGKAALRNLGHFMLEMLCNDFPKHCAKHAPARFTRAVKQRFQALTAIELLAIEII